MKRTAAISSLILLLSTPAFATYIVVLKNGTRYRAKDKWTVTGGKALVMLENGQTLQLDPGLIDTAKTSEVNRLGLGDVNVIAQETPAAPQEQPKSSLGSITKLRRPPASATPSNPAPADASRPAQPATSDSSEAAAKFTAAYDNIGIFDAVVRSEAPGTLRVELTADSEDKVFTAISATSYMLVRVPNVTGTPLHTVELFMKTINGGAAGRFLMSREDAQAIDTKAIKIPDYFVRKVIY